MSISVIPQTQMNITAMTVDDLIQAVQTIKEEIAGTSDDVANATTNLANWCQNLAVFVSSILNDQAAIAGGVNGFNWLYAPGQTLSASASGGIGTFSILIRGEPPTIYSWTFDATNGLRVS